MSYDTIDTAAIGLSGALALVATVGLGTVEILAGKPYSPVPLKNDAGEVIAQPAVDPTIRTGLIVGALVVLLVWGLYRFATATPRRAGTTSDPGVSAD
ncbi:hypothetical protein RYH80_17430 [Halobaculum sp. MBLA0147]|uniref:hypothetical protein n=1 Tax=Halobaculum sp. MBLA0147 TaxID=3079934 RepID=UPI0035232F20